MMADGYQYVDAMKLAAPRVGMALRRPRRRPPRARGVRARVGAGRRALSSSPVHGRPDVREGCGGPSPRPGPVLRRSAAARWAPAPRRQSMRLRIWGRQARPRCPSAGRAAGFQVGVGDNAG